MIVRGLLGNRGRWNGSAHFLLIFFDIHQIGTDTWRAWRLIRGVHGRCGVGSGCQDSAFLFGVRSIILITISYDIQQWRRGAWPLAVYMASDDTFHLESGVVHAILAEIAVDQSIPTLSTH